MDIAKNILHEILTECRGWTKKSECVYIDTGNKPVVVIFSDIDKLNIQLGKEYITHMIDNKSTHLIIIYHRITSSLHKLFSELGHYTIELFAVNDLQMNITKHELVPTHIKLSNDDAVSFKSKFGTTIPMMLQTDPISRVYNYQIGDIIKIIRKHNEISYRIVVGD